MGYSSATKILFADSESPQKSSPDTSQTVMVAAALQLLVSDRLPYTDIYLTYNSALIHYAL